ncbi:MAG: lamin tail domain-containing protein, partial [Flavobacteriales bacterium]|nr:lamin tail domain-containing protein [Flavobacteriales bacterium]
MKLALPISILILLLSYTSRAQFVDDFTDGDFTSNPTWSGDDLNYEVDLQNRLHLNHLPAVADESYLSTSSSAIRNATWKFYVEMDFFPSPSNLSRVYLVADQSNLEGPLNGYFVEIGNADDEVSLYRQDGSSSTKIIDGTDGFVNLDPVNVNILVTRDSLGNWELFADSTGQTNYVSQGTVVDNIHTQSNYFGVRSIYTSTRSDKFWYDSVEVTGTAYPDTIKPLLSSIQVNAPNQLELSFSENLETVSAESNNNYFVDNGIGNPSAAVLDNQDSSKVLLTFSNFPVNVNLNLQITGVLDRNGNIIDTTNQSFGVWNYDTASWGEVIINEVFADPSPSVGMPSAEFLEIYNPSTKTFDISNWILVNTTTNMSLGGSTFVGGDHLILCDANDVNLFNSFGNVLGIPSFTALTNGGDSLTLINEFGTVIDIVKYDDSWYNDPIKADGGYSLERINPNHPCSDQNNWSASNASNGGTPGTQNSIYSTNPDNSQPIISDFAINGTNLVLTFSKGIDTTLISSFVFAIDNGISVNLVEVLSLNSLQISFSPNLDSSLIYTLDYHNVQDCFGNSSGNQSYSFGIGTSPEPFDLVMSEFFPDPDEELSNLPEAEFVEIFNRSNKLIQLKDLIISDGTIDESLGTKTIFPDSYVILCSSSNVSVYQTYGEVLGLGILPSLNNSGDHFTLRRADGTLIHEVQYESDWYGDDIKDDGGWTLEMIDPDNPCGQGENWSASNDSQGGTPGTQNSVFSLNPDQDGPQIDWGAASNDSTVVVHFTENIFGDQWKELSNYTFSDGLSPQSVDVTSTSLEIGVSPKLNKQDLYILTIQDATDCIGNSNKNLKLEFALPEEGLVGDLIINEVLFDPRSGGTDFVELYNNSEKYIGLENWSLANFQGDSIANIKPITTLPLVLFPGDYIVLNEDSKNVIEEYPLGKSEKLWETDLPTYSNDEGSVILLAPDQDVIDRFDYTDDMQFALLDIVDGVSLERISFDLPTNDEDNWHSASEAVGFATPGYQNSQFLEVNNLTPGEVIVNPEIFSPDNDGYQDVVAFEYEFDQAGFVATVNVYDSRGRLEKIIT